MGKGVLVDTNVVIDFQNGRLPLANSQWLIAQVDAGHGYLSVINRIELLIRPGSAAEEAALRQFIGSCQELPLDEPVVQQTIRLRQQHRIKLPDALIAATALAYALPLLTRNVGDFRAVAGLAVLDPHGSAPLPGWLAG